MLIKNFIKDSEILKVILLKMSALHSYWLLDIHMFSVLCLSSCCICLVFNLNLNFNLIDLVVFY